MASMFNSANTNPVIRKLETVLTLTGEERDAVVGLPVQERQIGPRQDLVRAGDHPNRSFAILEGVACAFKITGSGKRQILVFHIAGDIPDLLSLHLETMDIGISTISPCKVGFIQHDALRNLCDQYPRLAGAFWRETLVYGSVYGEWVTNIGGRSAYNRAAHLFCEYFVRLRAMGLATDHSCEFPLTQTDLADALGLSLVHVNRVVQSLRRDGLIRLGTRNLEVPDWDRLKEAGDFNSGYLHLRPPERAAA